jgi:hypothetical protein
MYWLNNYRRKELIKKYPKLLHYLINVLAGAEWKNKSEFFKSELRKEFNKLKLNEEINNKKKIK